MFTNLNFKKSEFSLSWFIDQFSWKCLLHYSILYLWLLILCKVVLLFQCWRCIVPHSEIKKCCKCSFQILGDILIHVVDILLWNWNYSHKIMPLFYMWINAYHATALLLTRASPFLKLSNLPQSHLKIWSCLSLNIRVAGLWKTVAFLISMRYLGFTNKRALFFS